MPSAVGAIGRSIIDAAEQTLREAQADYDNNAHADRQVAADRLAILMSARKEMGRLVGQKTSVRFCTYPLPSKPGAKRTARLVHVVFGELSLCDERPSEGWEWRAVADAATCGACAGRWEALKAARAGEPATRRGQANLRRSLTKRGLLPEPVEVRHV